MQCSVKVLWVPRRKKSRPYASSFITTWIGGILSSDPILVKRKKKLLQFSGPCLTKLRTFKLVVLPSTCQWILNVLTDRKQRDKGKSFSALVSQHRCPAGTHSLSCFYICQTREVSPWQPSPSTVMSVPTDRKVEVTEQNKALWSHKLWVYTVKQSSSFCSANLLQCTQHKEDRKLRHTVRLYAACFQNTSGWESYIENYVEIRSLIWGMYMLDFSTW